MANQYINKVIYDGNILIDLTADTVVANKLLKNYTAHDKSGAIITGTCQFDAKTSDATASAAEILATKTAYVSGSKVTGTMTNHGGDDITVSSTAGVTISSGYYDGSGKAKIDATSLSNLIADNIRQGVTILGITGNMSGTEDVNAQSKTVTPSSTVQTITPDSPTYNYLAQVTVSAIPYIETDNAQGGVTVEIG